MRTFAHPVFILCLLLCCLNRLLEWNQVYIKFFYQYLDDLVCMPLVLSVTLAAERLYFRNERFVFELKYTLSAVLLFTIFFELMLPRFSSAYTADVLDVLCYASGALLFQVFLNSPLRQVNKV